MIEELKIVAEIMSGITDGAIYGLIGYFAYMLTSSALYFVGWGAILYLIGKVVIRVLCDNEIIGPDRYKFDSTSYAKIEEKRVVSAIHKYKKSSNIKDIWYANELGYLADVLEEGLKNKSN